MARKQYSAVFKAKVALEAIQSRKTVNEIATEHGLHPTQITQWKKQALEALPEAFSGRQQQRDKFQADLTGELYQQIGQLKVELDWLKKNLDLPVAAKRGLIVPGHPDISLQRQCELIGLNRSSWYYQAARGQSQTLPLLAEGLCHHGSESSLVHGYHLHPALPGVYLPGRHHRLVQPLCPGVASIQYDGCTVLSQRLWRSVKYEEVYPKAYASVPEAIQHLDAYFQFYNHQRLHQSLDYQPPYLIHFR